MNPDGTDPVNLTNSPEIEHSVSISADGSKVVFIAPGSSFVDPVWIMDFDGSNRRQLEATFSAEKNEGPAISPSGDRIAYDRLAYRDDPLGVSGWDIVLINTTMEGANLKFLELPGQQRGTLSWSPDEDKILYSSSYESSNVDIWVVNVDGTNHMRLTNHSAPEIDATWSPDGTKIAYTVSEDGWNIYVMNADGSNPTQLTDLPSQDIIPCWSPDGTQIGFSSTRDGDFAFYIMNSDGTNPQRVNGLAQSCSTWFSTATATQINPQLWSSIKLKSLMK
jgi:TolB protein